MKHTSVKTAARVALGLLMVMAFSGKVLADEKIGNLVFNAMKKIQETHQNYLGDAKQIKTARNAAVASLKVQREQFKKAKPGTLDRKEAHAQHSLALAQLYNALHDQAKLSHQVAAKQLLVLNQLNDAVMADGGELDPKRTIEMVKQAKPFLKDGQRLLESLAKYRHKITDPVINMRLHAAGKTAQMLARFTSQIENGRINRFTSQQLLRQKLAELTQQLNALYVQTDIFTAMVENNATRLKMINQIATAETAILALTDGKRVIANLSDDIMGKMMEDLSGSEEDMEMLTEGVLDTANDSGSGRVSQQWTQFKF